MNKEFQNLIKRTIIYLFLGVLAVSSASLAQRSRRDDTAHETRIPEKDVKKEQMRQEASKSFPQLSDALTSILEKVARNQPPEQSAIEEARQLLDENKRNGWAYDDKQKAQFMLLQAWTGFYQDNPVEAVNWSRRACKTDEANQDAWISQVLFSVLNDKRPMKPRKERPRSESRRRRSGNVDETGYEAKPKPFSGKGVLEFDVMGLRDQVFHQQFVRMKFQAADHSEIEFTPNEDTLCILFWQDDTIAEDAVDESEKADRQQGETMPPYGMTGMEMGTEPSSYSSKTDLEAQRKYFQMLMEACQDVSKIKFIQMNTTRPGNPEQFLSELPDYSAEPIPTVVAAQPNSGAERFIGSKAEKPFMMIIGAEGKVKYAGAAADFMPAFILTELTGVQIDLQEKEQVPQPGQVAPRKVNGTTPFDPMMMGYPPVRTPDKTPAPDYDPNEPVAVPIEDPIVEPNAPPEPKPAPKPAPKADEHQDFPTQSLEDQIRAEKLLQSAQMHIEESRKLRMKNPKQGIEDARRVLKEFPNTEYAQKARDLLRRVPSRWRTQHNITDEELGY